MVAARSSAHALCSFFPGSILAHRSSRSTLGSVQIRASGSQIPEAQVLQALGEVTKALQDEGNSASVHADGSRIVLELHYEDIDYARSEFKQVQPRDAIVEFAKNESGAFVVRSTQNSYVDAAVQRIRSSLETIRGESLTTSAITLESHADPKERTAFFESLIKGIPGYAFVTVTEAYCFKPKVAEAIEEDEEKELEEQPYVDRVTLRGQGVNRSFVIDDLYRAGYYIVKVVWQVKSKASLDSDIFELEAQFSNPASCTDFSYQHRCVIHCAEGKPTDKKRPPGALEQSAIFRLLEQAATEAYARVRGSA